MRGYFGIGIENGKTVANVGTLWRSAHNLGADFIFTIGQRYQKQASDTTKAAKSIPLYHYDTFKLFYDNMPRDCQLIGLEFPHDKTVNLHNFVHPERAIYLLGAEDHGLSKIAIEKCHRLVYIDSLMCLNVAVTGSIVMYDRNLKRSK